MLTHTFRQTGVKHRSSRRGAAALEMAIILPLSVTLVLGCIDFAQAIHAQIALTNAARVGADYAATHRFTEETQDDWEQALNEIVLAEAGSIPSFSPEDLLVTVEVSQSSGGSTDVSVICQYTFRTAVDWPALPSVIPLRHQVSMRQYQ